MVETFFEGDGNSWDIRPLKWFSNLFQTDRSTLAVLQRNASPPGDIQSHPDMSSSKKQLIANTDSLCWPNEKSDWPLFWCIMWDDRAMIQLCLDVVIEDSASLLPPGTIFDGAIFSVYSILIPYTLFYLVQECPPSSSSSWCGGWAASGLCWPYEHGCRNGTATSGKLPCDLWGAF